jgi:hypothetical protein
MGVNFNGRPRATRQEGGHPTRVIHSLMGVRIVYDEQLRIHDVHTFTNTAPYSHCPEGSRAEVAEGPLHDERLEQGGAQPARRRATTTGLFKRRQSTAFAFSPICSLLRYVILPSVMRTSSSVLPVFFRAACVATQCRKHRCYASMAFFGRSRPCFPNVQPGRTRRCLRQIRKGRTCANSIFLISACTKSRWTLSPHGPKLKSAPTRS